MSKRPTPKKQRANSQSTRQYKEFQNFARRRLSGAMALVPCPNCKELKLDHHVCLNCGQYNGRGAIGKDKLIDKITKVKA